MLFHPPKIGNSSEICGGLPSKEFKLALNKKSVDHQRIRPHGPEVNGVIESSNRRIREALKDEPANLVHAWEVMFRTIKRHLEERLHTACPHEPGGVLLRKPVVKMVERRRKLSTARLHR